MEQAALKVRLLKIIGVSTWARFSEEKLSLRGWIARCLSALPVIAGVMLVTCVFHELGFFRGFESAHLDTLLRLHPLRLSDIVIVEITKKDYHDPNLFNGVSPLNRDKLLDLVARVLDFHPTLIGVDIDTSDWKADCPNSPPNNEADSRCCKYYEDLIAVLAHSVASPTSQGSPSETKIVWAAVPASPDPPLEVRPVLGGAFVDEQTGKSTLMQGVPQFPVDPDGSVRHFENMVEVAPLPGEKCKPCYTRTFVQSILQSVGKRADPGKKETLILNYYGERYRFPIVEAGRFLSPRTEEETADLRKGLIDKTVLIGGAYPEARDEYFTPLGVMKGVELNALAIQTELIGGIHDVNRYMEYLVDVLASFIIIGLFYALEKRPRLALILTGGITIVLSLLVSILLFNRTTAYWFNFIPIAAGVVIHQLYELAKGSTEARKDLEKIKREIEHFEVDVLEVQDAATPEDNQGIK